MRTTHLAWSAETGDFNADAPCADADFALFFGDATAIEHPRFLTALRDLCPRAALLGCSTGTIIDGLALSDEGATAVAVHLERSTVRLASVPVEAGRSFEAGRDLGRSLAAPDLAGVLVLSDGLAVNGSDLVAGIAGSVGPQVPLGGGLAGDGAAFTRTLVAADGPPREGCVAALGFYGANVRISQGSAHGWENFGPVRRITRSEGSVLWELDGSPALDLYERYLGEEAKDLPGSALLYPLLIANPADTKDEVIRTVLAVDREARSMTFAGDMPQGWTARLMRGAFDNLAEGAGLAAGQALARANDEEGLSLLVSCVGRRLLMGRHTVNEVEAVRSVLGPRLRQIGFYSFGEIATRSGAGFCGLHNQTMTIMTLQEAA
jgi:hypothetical protein